MFVCFDLRLPRPQSLAITGGFELLLPSFPSFLSRSSRLSRTACLACSPIPTKPWESLGKPVEEAVSSRCWSPVHANECVLSCNEPQEAHTISVCNRCYQAMLSYSKSTGFTVCLTHSDISLKSMLRKR